MLHRCKVVLNIQGHEFGLSLGPGSIVNLDDVLGKTADGREVTVRESVNLDWFEPMEPVAEAFIPPAEESVDIGDNRE